MLWIISGYFLSASEAIWFHVIAALNLIFIYGTIFIFDAISISNKYKNMFIIAVVSYGTYKGFFIYFFVDDTNHNWNPFQQYNFKYSKINFKSVFTSSQLNLCLFLLKPIFTQISGKIRRWISIEHQQNTSDIGHVRSSKDIDDGVFVQRSYVLYKQPYIHWVVDSKSHLIEIGTPENSVSFHQSLIHG